MRNLATILIVDDEPAGRDVLTAVLTDQGYYLSTAGSGAEALSKAEMVSPDLVLLDIMMPGMDGYEVCRRLRTNPDLGQVPILMVTALEDRDSKIRGIEAGADDFISKPFDRVELRARVRTIIRLDRFRRLHSERAKFEWAVDNADDGYLILSADDDVLYANPKARAFLHLSADGGPGGEKFLALARLRFQVSPGRADTSHGEGGERARRSMGFLVRPESDAQNAQWIRVDRLEMGDSAAGQTLVRLSDVTAQMGLQRDCWTFNALVRHKLATPVGNMLGALDLLSHDEASAGEADRREMVALALRSARKLRDDVEKVFEYLKADGLEDRDEPGCAVLDIGEIAKAVAASLLVKTPATTVAVTKRIATARLALSRRKLELVLLALLDNSKKFHPEGSPAVKLSVSGDGEAVKIVVMDDGRSLSAEEIEKVWLPYYQGEKYFTGQVPGMGLGLSTVATIVGRVGGTCRIFNRPDGPGVAVEMTSPLSEARGKTEVAAPCS